MGIVRLVTYFVVALVAYYVLKTLLNLADIIVIAAMVVSPAATDWVLGFLGIKLPTLAPAA